MIYKNNVLEAGGGGDSGKGKSKSSSGMFFVPKGGGKIKRIG